MTYTAITKAMGWTQVHAYQKTYCGMVPPSWKSESLQWKARTIPGFHSEFDPDLEQMMGDNNMSSTPEKLKERLVVANACRCQICGASADRYEWYFECTANSWHMADLNTGIFTDRTPPPEWADKEAE